MWLKESFASLKSLGSWVADLTFRVNFFRSWLTMGSPAAFPLPVFFFPQGFMTASLQTYARDHLEAIDNLSFAYQILSTPPQDIKEAPANGVIVYGLYLEVRTCSFIFIISIPFMTSTRLRLAFHCYDMYAYSSVMRVFGWLSMYILFMRWSDKFLWMTLSHLLFTIDIQLRPFPTLIYLFLIPLSMHQLLFIFDSPLFTIFFIHLHLLIYSGCPIWPNIERTCTKSARPNVRLVTCYSLHPCCKS